ncbi:MAG: Zn-dependent alcohol dehydrogenase [Pseudomonadota bacterium]
MRAAVCRAFKSDLVIEEVTLAAPGPSEIEVEIEACAICHSDLSYIDGIWGGNLPLVLGHEAVGRVRRLGPGVTDFATGERVLVTLLWSCGTCPACADTAPTSCHNTWNPMDSPLRSATGEVVAHGMHAGAFAERTVVDVSQCIQVPDDMDPAVLSLLSCGVITGWGAVANTAKLRKGQTCAVIGAGGVGLNTIQGAAALGASRVIAVDVSQAKCDAAFDFGATDSLLAGPDLAEQILELTGFGVDYVFVTVGAPPAFQQAPSLLAPGGSVVLVGMPPLDTMVEYDPLNMASLNQSILGSRMGQTVLKRDIPLLLEAYKDGRLKLDALVTGRYPLEQINEAMAEVRAGTALRNVIVF